MKGRRRMICTVFYLSVGKLTIIEQSVDLSESNLVEW